MRIVARAAGVPVVAAIILDVGNRLGAPLYGLVAGVGVGGPALALAIRPTLENFVEDLALFPDKLVQGGEEHFADPVLATLPLPARAYYAAASAKRRSTRASGWSYCMISRKETSMKAYKGSCHCGAISFSFEHEEIDEGLRCNCSICRRKGAVMSAFTLAPEEIGIEEKEGALASYQFDTKVAKHYFCKICGIYPFHQTLRKPGHYRVNLGCIDDVDTNELPVELFDGKSI